MNKKIYEGSSNYTCTVVEIKNLTPIEGMNKILLTNIQGNNIVVSADTVVGEKGLFFPSECTISPLFLQYNNLFKHSHLNKDANKKGYFDDNGRVKALKLVKGTVISTGFYIPLNALDYLGKTELEVGDEFNELNGNFICKKYIPKFITQAVARSKNDKLANKFAKLIPDQFRLHEDTAKLALNLHKFKPNDIIAITSKTHGTSAVFANVLINRELKWYEKLAKKLGVSVVTEEYAYITSSRKVIKSVEINDGDQNHFYDTDIWSTVGEEVAPYIEKGVTLYGEIVGFLPSGKGIQGDYDYGCLPGKHAFYVYRITYTTPQGKVIEFSWEQIKQYCKKYPELKHVPEYYFGSAEDFYFRFVNTETKEMSSRFADDIFQFLQKAYNMEKRCEFCANDVPAEGLVVRRDGKHTFEAYKLKAKAFLLKESEDLDKNVVDTELMESL
ncbi:MAG TPA: RNA ligase family protein [Leptospiraceae bacterium]|nr:RNA ligase family protein [Leptospiraceae bacterium]